MNINKHVTILDYNVGNILNVARAFKYIGCEVKIAESSKDISDSTDVLVLPGVGAFGTGMAEVERRGFKDSIYNYVEKQKPFVGICLGMQMLFEESTELGVTKGLGLLKGQVNKIPFQPADTQKYPVPHIGWKQMHLNSNEQKIENGIVYFVHSYYAENVLEENIYTYVKYGKVKIPAAVKKGNTIGFQFHPEKSGPYGLKLLEEYVSTGLI